MTESQAVGVSHADTIRYAREHYQRVSVASHHWLSTIPRAIDALEREPDLIRERDWLKEHCLRLETALATALVPLEVLQIVEASGEALCPDLKEDIATAVTVGRAAIIERRSYVPADH